LAKQQHAGRARRLRVLRQLDGLAVPSVYTPATTGHAPATSSSATASVCLRSSRESEATSAAWPLATMPVTPGVVGEPAEVLTVGRLVDGQVGPEGRMLAA